MAAGTAVVGVKAGLSKKCHRAVTKTLNWVIESEEDYGDNTFLISHDAPPHKFNA